MNNFLISIIVISLLLSFVYTSSADSVFGVSNSATGWVGGTTWSSGFPSSSTSSSSSSSSSSSGSSSSSNTGFSSSVSSPSRNDNDYFNLPGQIKQAVTDGMINGTQMVFRSIADSIFSLGGATLATANNATLSVLVSHDDYLNNDVVKNARGLNAWWFSFLFALFAIVGALLVWKRYNNPLLGLHNTGLSGEQYAYTIVWGLVGVGTVFLLQTIFDLEYILSYTLVSTSLGTGTVTVAGVTRAVTIIPAAVESTPALIAFAVIFILSILYFLIRSMIITLVATYFLFLMGLVH